jgi:hypothetical protein
MVAGPGVTTVPSGEVMATRPLVAPGGIWTTIFFGSTTMKLVAAASSPSPSPPRNVTPVVPVSSSPVMATPEPAAATAGAILSAVAACAGRA